MYGQRISTLILRNVRTKTTSSSAEVPEKGTTRFVPGDSAAESKGKILHATSSHYPAVQNTVSSRPKDPRQQENMTRRLAQAEQMGEVEGFKSTRMTPDPESFGLIRTFFRERKTWRESKAESLATFMRRKNLEAAHGEAPPLEPAVCKNQ